ncbi:chloride channel protein [Crateriforma conspicua]|uniref:H(+)/Cl(-) exchange transporter ClcA n=1 Tax=Crateriforma conspicua TaxID=2527996 RepID=A0A5C5Y4L3_9PLAN|nr:chloride channel protein [Crateriforma conspicua]QDV64397.1 H(+)/Cl(-) exchange transporter ClcA [Crateriforma conspicua]TWT69799.1 H(+)/Cl(-) exchange transporter ClcA [Crateriforma conspicua]
MRGFRELLKRFELHALGKWILLSLLVGIVAGLGAIIFDFLGQAVVRFSLAQFAGYSPPEAAGEHARFHHETEVVVPWMIVVVMGVGGLVSGWLVYTFAPEAEGHGTDAAIDSFHNKRGRIRTRIPFVKTIASAITLGTGGSGGREGPIAQIGAGFGSWLATRLHLSDRERRIMLAAGMGAGVGAIFRAPLAGAVFAGEILYSDADMEADAVVPAASASIIAYSVYVQSLPRETRFVPLFGGGLDHVSSSPMELIAYAALALVLVLVGALYVTFFYRTHDLFKRVPIIPHLRPAIGAVLAGVLGIALLPLFGNDTRILGVLGTGYGTLQIALTAAQDLGVAFLVTVALVKIVTTALTIGSGGSGGVFGPSMVIGGCTGGAVGLVMHRWFPDVVTEPEAFAVVGMAGFFSGIARAPISTIIMVRALTGDYGLLLPTMLVTTLTFVISHRFRLYQKQAATRMDSMAHRGDFIVDVLEGLKVGDVYQPNREITLIPEGMTVDDIVHRLAYCHQHYFPVVDDQGKMVGIFSDDDVRAYLYDQTLWKLAVARDVMVDQFISVSPDDDLNTAVRRFTSHNIDELPVLDPQRPGTFLGMLRRKESIAAYNRRLMELKNASADDAS